MRGWLKPVRGVKLTVFDMDGVLVDVDSSWMMVHRAFRVDNEVNFQRYRRGEIGFEEFMRSDIALWGDRKLSEVKAVLDRAPLMPGASETVRALKEAGCITAIISSGISLLAERVQAQLSIDYVMANRILADGKGKLTGEGEVQVELGRKLEALERLTGELGLKPYHCAVVGDSRWDVPMFKASALSIAFNPKDDEAARAADFVVKERNLKQVLSYLLEG